VRIEEHNTKEGLTFQLGHNEFSDMTEEEFAAHFKLGHFSEAQKKEVAQGRLSEQRQSLADMAPLELPDYGTYPKSPYQ
jgi:hypothetical protein